MVEKDKIVSGKKAGSALRIEAVAPPGKRPGGADGDDPLYFSTETIDVAVWLMMEGFSLEISQRAEKGAQCSTDFLFVHCPRITDSVRDFYEADSLQAGLVTEYISKQIWLRKESREDNALPSGAPANGEYVCNKFDVAAWLLYKRVEYIGRRNRIVNGRPNWDYIFRSGDMTTSWAKQFFGNKDMETDLIKKFTDGQADLRRIKRTMEKRYGD